MTNRDFDAELYLRLLGERELAPGADLQHEQFNGRSHLRAAASALIVVGLIDADLAQSVVEQYLLASALAGPPERRRHQRKLGMDHHVPTPEPRPLTPRRVYALSQTVASPQGQLDLRSLTIGDEDAELSGVLRWSGQPVRTGGVMLNLRMPDGSAWPANFSGGVSQHSADGVFHIGGALPTDAEWIEIEGHSIPLPEPLAAPPFDIEPVSPTRRHMRYLWQLLAEVGDRGGRIGGGINGSAAAFIAAGLLDPDDRELAAVRWVAGARPHPQHPRGSLPSRTAPSTIRDLVPAEWSSLLSNHVSGPGPRGSIAIGAASPVFDGICVAVNALDSGPEQFTVSMEAAGMPQVHPSFRPVLQRPVAWWAADDRGHHYLGNLGPWSGHGDRISGQVSFPVLDSSATLLTLTVSSMAAQARLRIPLDWEA